MKEKNYSNQLESFVVEIIDLGIDEFKDPGKWILSKEILNGVLIGYELLTKTGRLLLHEIGQKHGVIPLCPDDTIDLKMSKEYTPEGVIVRSKHGVFSVDKKGIK